MARSDAGTASRLLAKRWCEDREARDLQRDLTHLNIFAALNATDYETRHSDFLAWLFDPRESHGTGTEFLKLFLSLAIDRVPNLSTATTVRKLLRQPAAFTTVTIEREKNERIDLLIVDRTARFVCLVENKIHSGE